MTTTAQGSDLHKLIDSLPDDNLDEALRLLLVLSKEPEEITSEELADLDEGLAEVDRGEWVWLDDVERADVIGSGCLVVQSDITTALTRRWENDCWLVFGESRRTHSVVSVLDQ